MNALSFFARSGKTTFIKKLLRHQEYMLDKPAQKIVYFYTEMSAQIKKVSKLPLAELFSVKSRKKFISCAILTQNLYTRGMPGAARFNREILGNSTVTTLFCNKRDPSHCQELCSYGVFWQIPILYECIPISGVCR